MNCTYQLTNLAPTLSFGLAFGLEGVGITPLHPVLVFCTVPTLWLILSSTEVVIVDTVLDRFSVTATVMGHVSATCVAPLFPLLPYYFTRTVAAARSCLASSSRD